MRHKLGRIPAHLMRRGSIYYFRQRVPTPLIEVLGKSEIRHSLGTGNVREAYRLASALAVHYDSAFHSDPSTAMIDIERIKRYGLQGMGLKIEWNGVKIESDPNNAAERAAALEALKIVAAQQATAAPTPSNAPTMAHGPVTLQALLSDYIESRNKPNKLGKYAKGWELDSRRKEKTAALGVLASIAGNDAPLQSFTRKSAEQVLDTLRILPPGWTRTPALRGMSIEKIAEQQMAARAKGEAIKTLSSMTISSYVSVWSGLFSYALENDWVSKNPWTGILSGEEKTTIPKSPYTTDELKAVFEGPDFSAMTADDPGKYWIPTMLLYTGARLNEVTQLLTSDVKEIEGIPCIHIIDDPETGKRLKNKGSRRIVPIHSQLVSLGFLDYVEARRRQGDVRLFPGLDKKYVGNWYGKYLKTTGIKRRGLDMHSLRHTVVQVFKVNEVPETHAASICGHTGSATDKKEGPDTYAMYGGQVPPPSLVKYVELLGWNLQHPQFNGRLDATRPGARLSSRKPQKHKQTIDKIKKA